MSWMKWGLGLALMASTVEGASLPPPDAQAKSDETVSSVTIAADFDARRDAALFVARYDATGRSGSITGHRVRAGSKLADATGLWGDRPGSRDAEALPHSTASLMDAQGSDWPAARVVLSHRSGSESRAGGGIAWEWEQLSDSQRIAMSAPWRAAAGERDGSSRDDGSAGDVGGRSVLAYLRGDRSREGEATARVVLRIRPSRHGAIVHSKPWFQPARPTGGYAFDDHAGFRRLLGDRLAMLYVGASDGMLHGFDAVTGHERIAYVPEGFHATLAQHFGTAQGQGAFVDGSPLSGDVYLGMPGSRDARLWRTYLAGFPGAGGRGYFVLDISQPQAFSAGRASDLVVLDRTAPSGMDPDIGRIEGEPSTEPGDPTTSRQIARLNNGRWALLIGNGSGSTDGRAVLLIQYLDGARELHRIVADAGPDNGLSTPRLIDLDGDGRIDIAYAGDLQGNLWKFDLTHADPARWKPAFGATPFFVARDGTAAARRQSIASAPVWRPHPEGGLMIAFGTGRRPPVSADQDRQPQTLYGLRDDTPVRSRPVTDPAAASARPATGSGAITAGRAALVAQTLSVDARNEWGTLSTHAVRYGGSDARRGWFVDLPAPRERVLANPGWLDGRLIDIWSVVPAATSGDAPHPPSAPSAEYRTTLDIVDGSAPRSALYAQAPAAAGAQASRTRSAPAAALRDARSEVRLAAPGQPAPPSVLRPVRTMKRVSWRQLQ
ncbi:PilC/PilY family type IV pilus protein [Variovorax sp. J22P168]|uniref:pilus assembly protein n=1 Tax=Variovorax jilinensis TaxID=3053513 RepID=UPI002577F019|nr:PilC/PilY family type IV pilus protein [Variovorax sp. J22P168]MDM0012059.1 PilC/PilY family type IV pilus protein [Variovorax sp. J22P168]